jgi:hypothetical protein
MRENRERFPFFVHQSDWRGQPLYDLTTVVNLMSHTTTNEGLAVRRAVDDTKYEKGINVTTAGLLLLGQKNGTYGGRNYTIHKEKMR